MLSVLMPITPPGWFFGDLEEVFHGFWQGKRIKACVPTRSKPSFPSKTNVNEGNLNAAAGGGEMGGKREENEGNQVESVEKESH